ncbi:MAG TPA: DinB family protein [Pyrinomonadaceae bacterium]
MDRINLIVTEWERARTGAREYIEAMPEEAIGFRPTPEVRTFAEHFLHVASANYLFVSAVTGKENPHDKSHGKDPEEREELKQSKEALLEFVLGGYDYLIEAVKQLDGDELEEKVKFFRMEVARELLLAKALEHHAHHRGQTAVYLRLKGIKPPSERLF